MRGCHYLLTVTCQTVQHVSLCHRADKHIDFSFKSRTAWSAPDKRQIPPVENQLAIFRVTCKANIKTTIRMRRKRFFYSYNFQEDTFRDCGEISDWNTVKLSEVPMFPHRRWEAAATYLKVIYIMEWRVLLKENENLMLWCNLCFYECQYLIAATLWYR